MERVLQQKEQMHCKCIYLEMDLGLKQSSEEQEEGEVMEQKPQEELGEKEEQEDGGRGKGRSSEKRAVLRTSLVQQLSS